MTDDDFAYACEQVIGKYRDWLIARFNDKDMERLQNATYEGCLDVLNDMIKEYVGCTWEKLYE